jgi:DNA-binding NarL/FixJ family response regulator
MRVVIADDSVLLREGIGRLLTDEDFEIAAKVGSAEELLKTLEEEPADVAVVDIRMPPTHTDEGLVAAKTIRPALARRRGPRPLSIHRHGVRTPTARGR